MATIKPTNKSVNPVFTYAVIPAAIILSFLIFKFIFGNPANFIDGNIENNPLPGNYLGIVYKGGAIVPILLSTLLIVITFGIERLVTIRKSRGKKPVDAFLNDIRSMLASGQIDQAKKACDVQQGSIANVVSAGLTSYDQMHRDNTTDKEHKILTIQKTIEETTSLELPMLSKNLPIISTIASVATLLGLLGTVLGMVKAFAAMATAGAPDAVALANGISEALINTALGVGTSALAIIMYNYFTTKIDSITYGIDEAGYSVVQSFTSTH